MENIYQLPIPDWDLCCPHCQTPLAGMRSHVCTKCQHVFNMGDILNRHRPIPDIGLSCPECDYLLTGLTGDRCPECGEKFSVFELFQDQYGYHEPPAEGTSIIPDDYHLKKREPTFTGRERPLPDFGLCCCACGAALKGALGEQCPACREPFDLTTIVERDWVDMEPYTPALVARLVRQILYENQIPYLDVNPRLRQMGYVPFSGPGLYVPREFFFDALHALTTTASASEGQDGPAWVCPHCRQEVPAGFEVCWNCNTACPDTRDGES